MTTHTLRQTLALPLAFGALVLGGLLVSSRLAARDRPAPPPPANPGLGGTERYLTHVSTDRPAYRPGETFYARAVVLRADSHAPLAGDPQPASLVEVRGPKGDTVASGYVQPQDGVVGFSWAIPAATPGGEYTLKVSHPFTGHAPGERKFDVRAYRAPRLKSQTVFLRDGYGPGDTVNATLHTERAEGGIPAGAKVTAIARVDGAEVSRGETNVDAAGNCSARFKLPDSIARGEGTLAWVIEDGGVVETATKTIPILLQTVDLAVYPEGGDLVAGLENRVYIEAFTPAKKPADLAGVVVDGDGREVASFKTEHEGRGRFSFTPKAGQKYTLKINEPAGIKTTYPLPAIREDGLVLTTTADSLVAGGTLKLRMARSSPGKVKLTLGKREAEVATRTIRFVAAAGPSSGVQTVPVGEWADVELTPPTTADGVLVATAWDEQDRPLAERLIFCRPAKSVKVTVTPDKSSYVPGAPATLTVTTTDDAGRPVGAVVGMTVTDDSVLEMIEKREQAPRLPVMVLLENDVRDLADAHVYLDPTDPKAPLAVDLLLGTQGWRRFALVEREKFLAAHGDAARRVLAMRVVTEDEQTRTLAEAVAFAPPANAAAPPPPAPVPDAAPAPAIVAEAPLPAAPVEDLAVQAQKPNVPADDPAADARRNEQLAKAQAPPAGNIQAAGGIAAGTRAPERPRANAKLEEALQQGQAGEARGRLLAQASQSALAVRNDFVLVREYAHAVRPGRQPGDRVDFAETLYWNAGVRTDARTGAATVTFATSDAVTSFRVFADAFTADGTLGSASSTIESVQPFYVEPKLPLQVTSGDVIRLPVALVNGTTADLPAATVKATAAKGITVSAAESLALKPGERGRRIVNVAVGEYAGTADFVLDATAGGYADRVTRKLDVRPLGFPVELAFGGTLGPDGTASYTIEIPQDLVPNSVSSDLAVYPTPLANMTQALEALIQSPSGCFEQTSSTTYPLVMAQQYFLTHTGVDPKLIERSRTLLDDGYNRLVGFECKTTRGFEWFGADPGHEALSAFGMLEFTDMAQVRDVDPRMLADTRAFVMRCRDGKGGFKRERQTLHTWIEDPDCSNGYITWALLECGEKGLEKEVAAYKEASSRSTNSYVTALGANILSLAGDKDAAKGLMDKLAAKQTKEGLVDGGTTTIVGSGGEALQIETTALATLAWLRDPSYAANVERSMKWLAEVCKAGRFGSTQSTVLALRAIVAYDKARATPKAPGTVQVFVDGKPMGGPQPFGPQTQGAIKLQDVREMMSPGTHKVELRMEKGAAMPFSVAVRYHGLLPPTSDKCKVGIDVALRDKELAEGGVTEADVTVTNRDAAAVPTPIAIVGIPGGLEVRHDQLKELVKSGKIDAYEVIGREVVLYWRAMQPRQKVRVPISLVAAIPGTYTVPASRSYLYYTDEFKHWVPGLAVKITPAANH